MAITAPDFAWLAALLVLAPCCTEVRAEGSIQDRASRHTLEIGAPDNVLGQHLGPDDSIGSLLHHPAFSGYAEQILPWEDRNYDQDLKLREIGTLLPYHTHVDPGTVVASLNHMIDEVAAGRPVFYDIYDEAEKRAQPDKEQTGLFFFRGQAGAPFAVVAPGGGFVYVGSVHEGFPYAREISGRGLNAFVLNYRVGQGGRVATEDMAAAVAYIFRNADALGVGTSAYSLWGSSAGARMAASIGSHGTSAFGAAGYPKPAAVIMAYTAHSDIAAKEPPTFVTVGGRDRISPASSMEKRIANLTSIGTAVEYRKFDDLGHGFGAGTGTSAEGWLREAVMFWERNMNR